MHWLKDLLLKKFHSLDLRSELAMKNKNYFEDLLKSLENYPSQNIFKSIDLGLSYYRELRISHDCILLSEKIISSYQSKKDALSDIQDSIYNESLINELDLVFNKITHVIRRPIVNISYLYKTLTVHYKYTMAPFIKDIDGYIKTRKNISDSIKDLEDEDTQLRKVKKIYYINKLNDHLKSLNAKNHHKIFEIVKVFNIEVKDAIDGEKLKIEKMRYSVESEIKRLDRIMSNNNLDHNYLESIERVRIDLIDLRSTISDSKYVLSKFYSLIIEANKIISEYELFSFRNKLLKNNKNATLQVLKSFIENSNNDNFRIQKNKVTSISEKINPINFEDSYKICQEAKNTYFSKPLES